MVQRLGVCDCGWESTVRLAYTRSHEVWYIVTDQNALLEMSWVAWKIFERGMVELDFKSTINSLPMLRWWQPPYYALGWYRKPRVTWPPRDAWESVLHLRILTTSKVHRDTSAASTYASVLQTLRALSKLFRKGANMPYHWPYSTGVRFDSWTYQ